MDPNNGQHRHADPSLSREREQLPTARAITSSGREEQKDTDSKDGRSVSSPRSPLSKVDANLLSSLALPVSPNPHQVTPATRRSSSTVSTSPVNQGGCTESGSPLKLSVARSPLPLVGADVRSSPATIGYSPGLRPCSSPCASRERSDAYVEEEQEMENGMEPSE